MLRSSVKLPHRLRAYIGVISSSSPFMKTPFLRNQPPSSPEAVRTVRNRPLQYAFLIGYQRRNHRTPLKFKDPIASTLHTHLPRGISPIINIYSSCSQPCVRNGPTLAGAEPSRRRRDIRPPNKAKLQPIIKALPWLGRAIPSSR
jgi:hypothetical protein